MPFDRAAMLTYASNRFAGLAAEIGVTATDDAAGYGTAIDDALLMLGTPYDDLFPNGSVAAGLEKVGRAAISYWTLVMFRDRFTAEQSLKLGATDYEEKASNVFAQINTGLAYWGSQLAQFGYIIEGGAEYTDLPIDYIETGGIEL